MKGLYVKDIEMDAFTPIMDVPPAGDLLATGGSLPAGDMPVAGDVLATADMSAVSDKDAAKSDCYSRVAHEAILTTADIKLLMRCIDRCTPKLVYVFSRHGWYYCPQCESPLEREYMRNCDSCGQRLRWWGCVKHGVLKE